LGVDYTSQDVIRGQDPGIEIIDVISLGLDSFGINRDNAVDDFGVTSWRDKKDHISRPDCPAIVGNDVKTIPSPEGRVHARANVIN
jgi:hypothetical protein